LYSNEHNIPLEFFYFQKGLAMNRCISRHVASWVFFVSFALLLNSNLLGQNAGYQLPPQQVVNIIDAPPEPAVSFSPDTQWLLIIDRDAMPGIEDVSRRMLQLAGLRIDPAANGQFQSSFAKGLSIRARDSKKATRVPLPRDAKLSGTSWSHDSKKFAFVMVTHQGQQLWVAHVDNPTEPKLLTDRLNTVMGGFSWMPDGNRLVCQLVPENRAAEPVVNTTPTGPNIQESIGNTSPTRTYQDLLSSPSDEALFEYYATTQLAVIGADGAVRKIGEPNIIAGVSPSPNGKHLLATTIRRPFSYLMTHRSFPRSIQVLNVQSGTVDYTVAEVPMAENIPIEGVRTGPRNIEWKSVEPATLIWAEALDGGDPNKEAEHRDRIMVCRDPFNENPVEILKIQHRSFGVEYFADPSLIVTTQYDRDRRWIRSLLHDLKTPGTTPKTLMDRSIRDRYGDPGRLVSQQDETGHIVIRQDGVWVYRMGRGASQDGDLPFVDRQDLTSLKSERLWRCEKGTYESPVEIAASSAETKPTIITAAETPTTPSNYYLRNLNEESKVALTDFKDSTPQIRGIKKQLVTYERNDGVPLSATLYLPADYQEGTRLPLLVWAYPREFNDAQTAAQISGSPFRFTRMRGITHLTLLTQGYVIMDAATMPVIGDPETMNDTFIEQIVAAAQAAIDKAVEMGVADRDRVCVGGHSYGAFMTANLLAHCDLFKAGIARSGAYNRTLTPFGFQSERRDFWNAKDVYFNISPFMHANKINEPLLLIHGENDNNSGTFPIQSKRMYQAVKGNGGTVRLCMLPAESHGYRARESVLHAQAEMIAWFDKYVKNAKPVPEGQ
jgi:dipeptidyl aminopeptidase/acylaminoacyl peptidase